MNAGLRALFDAEISVLLNTGEAASAECLISGTPLDDTHISLACGHKFNYVPIYEDVVQQKYRRNQLEIVVLGKNNIKCPYCNNVQDKLLPYREMDGVRRLVAVNSPESSCMTLYECPYVMKSGKRKGEACSKGCNTTYCKSHIKYDVAVIPAITTDTNVKLPSKPPGNPLGKPSCKQLCACRTRKGTKCTRAGAAKIENEHIAWLPPESYACKQHHTIYSNALIGKTTEEYMSDMKVLFGQ